MNKDDLMNNSIDSSKENLLNKIDNFKHFYIL